MLGPGQIQVRFSFNSFELDSEVGRLVPLSLFYFTLGLDFGLGLVIKRISGSENCEHDSLGRTGEVRRIFHLLRRHHRDTVGQEEKHD